jgi:capsular polysaccharide biosynthesis protein
VELTGYLAVARRWWWTLLVATWVAGTAGYVVADTIPPTYEASTQLLVGPYNTDRETLSAAGALVQTYSELVTTTPLLESAIAEADADMTANDLAAATRVTANDTTRFLSIRVQDTDREMAATLANKLADEISQLASRGTNSPPGQLQIVDFAEAPDEDDTVAPQVGLIVGLAALAALIGAMVLVMIVEYLSAAVRTEDELDRLTGLPFLGKVDTARALPTTSRALIDNAADSAAAAAYRLIVAKVAFRGDRDRPVRSIVVLGTGPDSTTGQVAANLAAITARGGRQIILVDGDTVGSPVTRIYGLEGRSGMSDMVAGGAVDVAGGLVRVSSTLRVVPRGTATDNDTLEVERARTILATLATHADFVIVSTAPLHLSASALVWAQAADTSLIVAARDQSRRDDVTYAVESLRLVGADLAGTVLAERRRGMGRSRSRSNEPPDRTKPVEHDRIEPERALATELPTPTPIASPVVSPIAPTVVGGRPRRSPRRRGGAGEPGA